jgi:hypothetical protein
MNQRRAIWLLLGLLAALVLAFLLRDLVQTYLILPIANLVWRLVIIYHSFPQIDYWFLLLIVMLLVAIASVAVVRPPDGKKKERKFPQWGSVARLAFWIERSKRSNYSKWHVARMLAETGLQILEFRERRPLPERKLEGKDWHPPAPIQDYLQTALKTTFAEYSQRPSFLSRPKTPLDQDLAGVIEYLESQLEESSK